MPSRDGRTRQLAPSMTDFRQSAYLTTFVITLLKQRVQAIA